MCDNTMTGEYYYNPRPFYDSALSEQIVSLDDLFMPGAKLISNYGENKSRASSTGKLRESGKVKRRDFGEEKLKDP